MVIPLTRKVTLFHIAILLFIYVDCASGGMSWFGKGKDKTQVEKTKIIPVRHKRLETPAKVNQYGKKQKEAFITLLTYPLGFMNTDTQQSPFIENYLVQYRKYKKDYEVAETKIEEVYDPKDPWCRDLLQEPVLQDNGLYYQPDTWDTMEQPKKIVQFDYFSKAAEEHDVIQCPVVVRNHKVTIYFATFGASAKEHLKYYFVLTASNPSDQSELVVIMRTKFHNKIEKDKNDYDCYNEHMYDFLEVGQIRLNIKPSRVADEYRLFGKYAEAAFILTNYGFWNPTIHPVFIYRFIETTLVLSKGYKIKRKKLTSKTVKEEGPHICQIHINSSRLFRTYKIEYDGSRAEKIQVVKQEIASFIPGMPRQIFRLLSCPVTQGSEDGFILHRPIHFERTTKFVRYDIFWYVAADGEYKGNEVLLFLAPNSKMEKSKVQFQLTKA